MNTKTKYVPVTFKTPEELFEALLGGRVFTMGSEDTVLTANICSSVGNYEIRPIIKYTELYEVITECGRWEDALLYENKEGILCWCWDSDSSNKIIDLVSNFYPENIHPYITQMENYWKHAVPLTKEEVEKYLYKGD